MPRLKEIVFDCHHPAALARFWAAICDGYAIRAYDDDEIARLAAEGLTPETDPVVMVDGPGPTLCFLQEERGRVQGRIHLDLEVRDRASDSERVLALGARLLRKEATYTTFADPEGNHFCLIDAKPTD